MSVKTQTTDRVSPPAALLLLLLPVFLRALTPIFLKTAALKMDGQFTVELIVVNVFYYIALFLFFLRAVTWQIVLRRFSLSFAYPFNSLAVVFILINAAVFFDESVRWFHILGALILILGLIGFVRSGAQEKASVQESTSVNTSSVDTSEKL